MKIKMFTKTVCPTCKVAKQQLSYLPVPVEIEEINIEDDTPFYDFEGNLIELKVEYMMEKLESMSTPTFLFEDGTVVRGYEEGELRTVLGL